MKRTVVKAGMGRLAASALALTLAAIPALAGDRALIDYIGYSPDAKYFAFEEFGVQDGSGFPYATVYVVDLDSDQWVGGSPFRVVLEDEAASVEDARNEAYTVADGALSEFETNLPHMILALNGDGDARTGEGHSIAFGQPGYGLSEMPESQTLKLDLVATPPSADCAIIDNKTFGFALSLDGKAIHADGAKLPASRGCPMGYKIYAVLQPADWSMTEGGTLAVVSTYPFGFEGPDRRFLVVPLALD